MVFFSRHALCIFNCGVLSMVTLLLSLRPNTLHDVFRPTLCHKQFLQEIDTFGKPCNVREDPRRLSSCPFLSGDTLRAAADWIYDETSKNIDPKNVRTGDVIFVKTDLLSSFFQNIHPLVSQQYVLITHNSDLSAPSSFSKFLNDEQLGFWFTQNYDSTTEFTKVQAIPIGLENYHWKTSSEFEYFVSKAKHPKPFEDRSRLLFVSLGNTNPKRRQIIENVQRQNVSIEIRRLTYSAYIDALADSKFVLSPPGNGLDCHRTWEVRIYNTLKAIFTH